MEAYVPVFTVLATGIVGIGAVWLNNRRQDTRDQLAIRTAARQREADRLRAMFVVIMESVITARRAVVVGADAETLLNIVGMTCDEYRPRLAIERDGAELVRLLEKCYELSLTYGASTKLHAELLATDPNQAGVIADEWNAEGQRLVDALNDLASVLVERMAELDAPVQ